MSEHGSPRAPVIPARVVGAGNAVPGEAMPNCTIGQLDTRGGERVPFVALRVGTVITEHNQFSSSPQHQVRLYQIETRRDDRLSAPLPCSSVPGSEDLRLVILGELPRSLQPGCTLRLIAIDPRAEQDPDELAFLEAAHYDTRD